MGSHLTVPIMLVECAMSSGCTEDCVCKHGELALLCAANVAAAQLRLGVMYEHGLGVKLDYKVATALHMHGRNTTYQCRRCHSADDIM